MGLLDLPASALSWADGHLSTVLPALWRIVLWGAIGAALSLGLYWLLSPQARIERIVDEERRLKTTLKDDTLDMADGLAASKDLLRLAFARIGLVLVPVLLATLPIISLMTWLDSHYAHTLPPPGQTASVKVEPEVGEGRWVNGDVPPPRIEVVNGDGSILQSLPMSVAVPIVEKWVWWNALIGNPLGYLPDDSPIERIVIGLPASEYLSFGPDWLRGWLAPFLISLLVFSLFFKIAFRIH